MELFINGEKMRFDAPMRIEALIGLLGLETRKIAIERNLEIVPKSRFGDTMLADGDRLEIVHFVGGG